MPDIKERLRSGEPQAGFGQVEKGYRLLWHSFDVLILQQFVRQTAQWRSR
ncbi:hypothetical protein [Nocardioides sediminis]|nr:hypothetical protein [Nocardioides sediminis]